MKWCGYEVIVDPRERHPFNANSSFLIQNSSFSNRKFIIFSHQSMKTSQSSQPYQTRE